MCIPHIEDKFTSKLSPNISYVDVMPRIDMFSTDGKMFYNSLLEELYELETQ